MPDVFQYRECRATITARIPDTPDADAHPDRVLVQGRGTAHPQFQGGSVVFPEIGEYAIPQPIPVVIVDGELLVEVLAGDESVETQPLFLPVTVDERANQNWSWRLVFDFLTLGEYGDEVKHPPLSFPVEAGDGPLEISTVATPVIKSQGFITRGRTGVSVEDARRVSDTHIEFLLEDGGTTQPVELGLGRDGSNVLPTGVAIAQAIGPDGVARGALDTAIGQLAVTSTSVGRIITSTDPAEPLAEGEVLLVYQGPRSWTEDFTDGLYGMTPRWNARDRWQWEAGDVTLLHPAGEPGWGSVRSALSIDALGQVETEVELLSEVTVGANNNALNNGLILRGSGTPGKETGFAAGLHADGWWVGRYTDGAWTLLSSGSAGATAGEMFRMRFRVGDRLQFRLWRAANPEPTWWTYDDSLVTAIPPGWYGLASALATPNFTQRWHRVAVATQGGTAALS